MKRFRERQINPPEPLCPRCRKICWPDELRDGKCPHCGFDGSPDTCVVCKKPISPSSGNYGYSICESCEEESHRQQWEEEALAREAERHEDLDEYERYESLDRQTENECYAIEQGAKSEEDMDALTRGGDAS